MVRGVAGRRRRRERRAPLPRPRRRAAALSRRLVRALERALPAARSRRTSRPGRRTRTAAGRSPGPSSTLMPPRCTRSSTWSRSRDGGPAGGRRRAEAGGFRRIRYFRSAPTSFGEKYLDELTAVRADRARHPREPRRPAPRRGADQRHRGAVPLLRPGRSRLRGPRQGLRPLLRRHRERAAAPELPEPAPGRDREPERPGRTLLQRPSGHAAGARRGDLHPDPAGGDAVFRPLRGVRRGARHAADAAAHQLPRRARPCRSARSSPAACSATCRSPSG